MRFRILLFIAAILGYWIVGPGGVTASNELPSEVPPENVIQVQLGSENNQMRFFPAKLRLVQGERYQMTITNPSPVTHEFASEHLSAFIVTEVVKFFDDRDRLVAYVRGTIDEVELLPDGRIEWFFVAARVGDDIDLFCDIPGHRDAGMLGSIEIRPAN